MPSNPTFARRERDALADLALAVGADAPTLCAGWQVKDLVVHLLVRERNPLAQLGMLLPPLAWFTRRSTERWSRADLPLLADQLRRPALTWARIGPLDSFANSAEYFVHHEDIRRAQPEWAPRDLGAAAEDLLWRALRPLGVLATRSSGVPHVVEDSRTGAQARVRPGDGPVVVSGLPSEVLLHLLGRPGSRVEVSGPDLAVRRWGTATVGF